MKTLLALIAGLVSTGAAMAFPELAVEAPSAVQAMISSPQMGTGEMVAASIGLMLFVVRRRAGRSVEH